MPSWSWQWMTYSECCLLIFYKSPKKWFIYILRQSRRSAVLWFPSLQKYNLSPIYLAMSQCPSVPPFLHIVHMHLQTPQHLYPQTKPIVPKLLPTIWEQICQKCHYNFRVIFPCYVLFATMPRLSNRCWSWFQWIKSGNQRSDGYMVINDEHERILIWCLNIKVILIDVR